MDLTKILKETMQAKNITQSELAKLTNQTRANLSKKMIANDFRFNEFEKLINTLGYSVTIKITPTESGIVCIRKKD